MKQHFKYIVEKYKGMFLGLMLCGISLFCLECLFGVVCPMRLVTGFPCPGCGLTRAGMLFLQGRFVESFQMNAFFILGLIFGIIALIVKKLLKIPSNFINIYAIIIVVLCLTYYGYRMERYFPDTEPLTYWQGSFLTKLLEAFKQ